MERNQRLPALRIEFLDALRGVAILSVVLFHTYSRWSNVVPIGSTCTNLFWFGWAGVQLFFSISGFVILMTLEKCSTFGEFVFRRWARLFPAMLVGSCFVFLTSPLFPDRPLGYPILRDLLPGLTFTEPSWWEALLGTKQGQLEWAFWSLYVEFKFYIVFGVLYFAAGQRNALLGLAIIGVLASRLMGFMTGNTFLSFLQPVHDLAKAVGGKYYGWFLFGALLYSYYRCRLSKQLVWVALASILAIGEFKGKSLIAILFVLCIFALSIHSKTIQKVLEQPLLLFFGFISYPLYLIHENLAVAMMIKLNSYIALPGFVLPLVPIALLCLVAWLIAFYAEPWFKRRLVPVNREAVPLTL